MQAAQESSQFFTSGTPIWASMLLPVAAAYLTHRFAKKREEDKDRKEALKAWCASANKLLGEIVELAVQHYYSPQSLPTTQMGAFELKRKLTAFSKAMRKTECTEASDMVAASGLPSRFRDLISLPADFEDPCRSIRSSSDDLKDRLNECEAQLESSISAPRRFVKK